MREISKKLKNTSIITISIILVAILVVCGVILFKPKADALTSIENESKRVANGADLFLSRSTINDVALQDMLAKGKGAIVNMAGKEWEAVYRGGDFLTLWMTDCYMNGTTRVTCTTAKISTTLDTIYTQIFGNYTIANNIVVSPKDLYDNGLTWQTRGYAEVRDTYNSSYYSGNGNTVLYEYFYISSDSNISNTYDQKLWLPSAVELFNQEPYTRTIHYGNYQSTETREVTEYNKTCGGIFNTTDIMINASDSYYLRSKLREYNGTEYDSNSTSQMAVSSGGGFYFTGSSSSYALRPAVHLSVSAMKNYIGNTININPATAGHVSAKSFEFDHAKNALILPIKPTSPNYRIVSITDNLGNTINLNGGSKNASYAYSATQDPFSGEVMLTLTDVCDNVNFTVNTETNLSVTNRNSMHIKNLGSYRVGTASTTANLYAEYLNDTFPCVSLANGAAISIREVRGAGSAGGTLYEYTFRNGILKLTLNGLPSGVYNISFDILKVNLTAPNMSYDVIYNSGGGAQINIRPPEGTYIQQFIVNGVVYPIEYFEKSLFDYSCSSDVIIYRANEITNAFFLYFATITSIKNISFQTSNAPLMDLKEEIRYGGAQINGVAVATTVGGDAKIVANDAGDNTSEATEVVFAAWVYSGYDFKGWSVDEGKTYLTDPDGNIYGISARIPLEKIKGKVVTAYFESKTNNNINTDVGDGNFV